MKKVKKVLAVGMFLALILALTTSCASVPNDVEGSSESGYGGRNKVKSCLIVDFAKRLPPL